MSKLLLADGFNLLMRGFYALPLLTNQTGEYTNAVYGFLNIFLRFMDEEKPDYVIVAFDLPKPTFRHERYGAYKGTRSAMPEELRPQIPLLRELLSKMNVCQADCPGFEADDVIGTLAANAEARGFEVVIVSGDRDLLQLATEKTQIRLPKTKGGKSEVEDYRAADVLEKMGVTPRAYIDLKALMGDTSDNIPGVPGIGPVTATKIIVQFGSLENAIAHSDEIKPKKASENLAEFKEQALLSKELAEICLTAPVELDINTAAVGDMWNADAQNEMRRLELKTFYPRFKKTETASVSDVRLIADEAEALNFLQDMNPFEPAAFHAVTEDGVLLGAAFACEGGETVYIQCGSSEVPQISLNQAISSSNVYQALKRWFESDTPKLAMDSKQERQALRRFGISLGNIIFDAVLAGYVAVRPNMDAVNVAGYLNETLPTADELLENKGKKSSSRKRLEDLPEQTLANFAGKTAEIVMRAYPVLTEELRKQEQLELYETMELPLAECLAEMENTGIRVDAEFLQKFGGELDEQILRLAGLIFAEAGEEFNILSPAQLGVILFEKLGLKGTKKTKQGYSTAADVLEKLRDKHPIIPLILEYRTFTKLKSTYVDGLLPLIVPETSRIHSTFHQALTATGRLSSAEPNLQNIPVRTELGRELRKVFIPAEGCVFVDADYSQIELRILAHMAEDAELIRAFMEGGDIHRLTASQVFHAAQEDVTSEQRSAAKAVNFGIIYGISAFGLSDGLQISKKDAEKYIEGYFETYPGVKRFMDKTVADANEVGYVKTVFNRKRAMPELKSSNFVTRSFGERAAMNMPIQGTAADIIKLAMLKVDARLKREGLAARLVLQVHDELLLEAPETETDAVIRLVKEEMENAAKLSVPLVADVHVGKSWYEAK